MIFSPHCSANAGATSDKTIFIKRKFSLLRSFNKTFSLVFISFNSISICCGGKFSCRRLTDKSKTGCSSSMIKLSKPNIFNSFIFSAPQSAGIHLFTYRQNLLLSLFYITQFYRSEFLQSFLNQIGLTDRHGCI